jgi:anti-sigma factor RsiW
MVAHLEDVASSDQHTVKPWFGGKLDYSPPVGDFASQGFPLAGGRLDYIGQRSVAALVYRHRGHVINVFAWPIRDPIQAQSLATNREGYHLVALSSAGMQYWIVSDLNGEELRQFASLLQVEGDKSMK